MLKALFSSKKFVAALVGVAVALLAKIGIELDTQDVAAVVSPIIAYIIGQGITDVGKSRAQEIVKAMDAGDAEEVSVDAANQELTP